GTPRGFAYTARRCRRRASAERGRLRASAPSGARSGGRPRRPPELFSMDTIDLASDQLGPDLLPLEELADCAAAVVARDGRAVLSYAGASGYTPLRELIGEWFGAHPSRVVLTN